MIVTEEEAKTKRCQESFSPPITSNGSVYASSSPMGGYNDMGGTYPVQTSPSHCIGSACMAWRWAKQYTQFASAGPGHFAVPVDGSGITSGTHGYCGKAGKP